MQDLYSSEEIKDMITKAFEEAIKPLIDKIDQLSTKTRVIENGKIVIKKAL